MLTCTICGASFSTNVGRGRLRKYCSDACRTVAARIQDRERVRSVESITASWKPKPCKDCGAGDTGWWRGTKAALDGKARCRCRQCYLTTTRERSLAWTRTDAYQHAPSTRRRLAASVPKVACSDCGNIAVCHGGNRQRCSKCAGLHLERTRGIAAARRRNAVKSGDQSITWRTIGDRDSWICHLCGGPVRKVAGVAKVPMGATVDHLVPISAGGQHELVNVALAHRSCNVRRGAQGVAQLRLVG